MKSHVHTASKLYTHRIHKRSNQIRHRVLFIPILGNANCGPANIFAEENYHGFLHVSTRLVERVQSLGLFVIKADGFSMNRANIAGKSIEDGDYVIVDSKDVDVRDNDIVLAIVDGKATVKRFTNDDVYNRIILQADSSYHFEPIILHEEDECIINGKVIGVIKKSEAH